MMELIKQARAAVILLNPVEVRKRARRPVRFGLVASGGAGYAAMEEFLLPAAMAEHLRTGLQGSLYRVGDAGAPDRVDLVLYEHGIAHDHQSYTFRRHDNDTLVQEILDDHDDLALPLARHYPAFRKPVVDRIVQTISRENALFAIATALPNIVPSMVELPWAFGEFASDTAFLTGNQIRMAFHIAAACGKEAGFSTQIGQVLSIVGGAFGWRALARELVGKIPLGGGLIPKGAIAYAGTYLVGKSLEYYHHANVSYTPEQREEVYREALERGREVAESLHADQAQS